MRRGLVRWAYLIAVASMLIWIISSVVGGYVYKRADGLVVGDAGMISPEYIVTVLEIMVKNGDRVKKGDIIAKVSSTRVAEITAALSLQSSTLTSRMAEIGSKSGVIDQLVTSAEMRDQVIGASNESLQISKQKGYLPLLSETAIADQVFRSRQELAVLKAERQSIVQQTSQVNAASRFVDQALADIQMLFDAGKMKAPMSGFISGVEAGVGAVIMPGGLVAEMVGEEKYVVAYFPVSRVYDVQVGAPVMIEVGFGKWLRGKISRVEPIAARLPKEFQRTLSPVERQQLVRIDFDQGQDDLPPYFTKVIIR